MASPEQFDAIVIGTGQGGKPLAGALAKAGWKTAILERADLVGGTCVTVGCTPTKTMVRGNVPATELRDAIFAHPCLSEVFNNLFAGI